MSLDPITAGFDLADDIVKLFPNKNAQEQAQLKIQIQQMIDNTTLAEGQMATNTAEASSESVFVAGGRPFIMWVCGFAFAWQYLLCPIYLTLGANIMGHALIAPAIDTTSMITVLMGMLGLGSLRSYDKVQVLKNK
jgi:hypothetical protein